MNTSYIQQQQTGETMKYVAKTSDWKAVKLSSTELDDAIVEAYDKASSVVALYEWDYDIAELVLVEGLW